MPMLDPPRALLRAINDASVARIEGLHAKAGPAPFIVCLPQGVYPVFHALRAGQRRRTAIIDVLCRCGSDPNAPSSGLEPAVLSALAFSDRETLQVLLRHGADPNLPGFRGRTALHYAARRSDIALLECLLAHGADPRALDAKGQTPLAIARADGHRACLDLLEAAERGLRLAPARTPSAAQPGLPRFPAHGVSL